MGEWFKPYTTMDTRAESVIAGELHKFVANKLLYRGFRPVMWSPVEKTALAEAEVEYHDKTSPTIYVKFPVVSGALKGASIVIWTTTPWTIPGNRAIAYSPTMDYGLYEVVDAEENALAKPGEKIALADALADQTAKHAKVNAEPSRRRRSEGRGRRPSLPRPGLRVRRARPSRRSRHRRHRHRIRPHRARPWRGRFRADALDLSRLCAHQSRRLQRREGRRLLLGERSALRRQVHPVARRQEGRRREQIRDRRADRGRRAARPGHAAPFLSA
ncbi:MAG: class I tRNA ligase family protein [Rhizomicrobium sp.]